MKTKGALLWEPGTNSGWSAEEVEVGDHVVFLLPARLWQVHPLCRRRPEPLRPRRRRARRCQPQGGPAAGRRDHQRPACRPLGDDDGRARRPADRRHGGADPQGRHHGHHLGGSRPGDEREHEPAQLQMSGKRLQGALFGNCAPRNDVPMLLDLYMRGQLMLDELVTTTYELDDVNQAVKDMREGKNLRGLITYG